LSAVLRPGERRTRRGNDRPEARIGNDVDPGQGGLLLWLKNDDVLAAVLTKATQAIAHNERGHRNVGLLGAGTDERPHRSHRDER
jgi:hypothetical protein